MADSNNVLTSIDADSIALEKIGSGKVREIFEIDDDTLLFVATDRISAYDVILENGIPGKGALLTQLSAHWFSLIKERFPEIGTHVVSTSLPAGIPAPAAAQLQGRSMQVRRLPVIALESIVRGYITGSAWSEYKKSGTVHGMPMPAGLQESQKLDKPMWTPSTKAGPGEHDENISRRQAVQLIGEADANQIEAASLKIYEMARAYADERGIIIADTKFEFGVDRRTGAIVLIDEVLTPDSSRFWPKAQYAVGRGQASYDKQYLRDWLADSGRKGQPGVRMPDAVVQETANKYREAYEKLTGTSWA